MYLTILARYLRRSTPELQPHVMELAGFEPATSGVIGKEVNMPSCQIITIFLLRRS
jgi:hypothetical protein